MSDLIMQLAGVIQRDINGLGAIAQNVANSNSPGYKASRTFSVYAPGASATTWASGFDSVYENAYVEPTGGALHVTGRATDLAVDGDAWFVLIAPDGPRLTRDGRFRVDESGYLVGDLGHPLLGVNGPIHVAGGVLEVDASGVVRVDGSAVGQIHMARVSNPNSLRSLGNGTYTSDSPFMDASGYTLHQGMQERSNSALGSDMVRMLEITRHAESMQRALSAYDSLLDSGINQFGKD